LLIHERIDFGFAMLTYYVVNLWSKKRRKFTDFLPPWYDRKPAKPPDPDEAARRLFERLTQIAQQNERQLSQR
jgi:hypothetical protein